MGHTITNLSLTDAEDIKLLRQVFKAITDVVGFKPFLATRATTAALELARNVIEHGQGGHARISLFIPPQGREVLLRMVFADQGPGIEARRVEQGRAHPAVDGMGLGLDGVQRMADGFDLQSGRSGTRVRADFKAPIPAADAQVIAHDAADLCDEILMRQGQAERRIRQLEADLDAQTLMVSEVHHRTANNLAMISSLLRMEQRRAQTDEAKGVLASVGIRVEALARTHKLLQTGNAETVNAQAHLSQVAALSDSFARAEQPVKVRVETDDTAIPARLALDLGLITGELITNAYKHAFEGRDDGQIIISLTSDDETITYGFRDNGKGLAPGQMPERSGSLGWRMIRGTVAGNMGHLEVNGSDGLQVTISFPKDGPQYG